jgi:hypothetical protein
MLGQPKTDILEFNVTDFKVMGEGTKESGAVLEILNTNESFTLRLDFEGSGGIWKDMCDVDTLKCKVHFDAEGIGPWPHHEYHLQGAPLNSLNLVRGKYDYEIDYQVPNGIPQPGVYRLSAMVEIENRADPPTPWKGVLGFAEGLVIQVSDVEEYSP